MDFNAVAEKLASMQQMHIQLRQCSLERVLNVISLLRVPRPPTKDSESDSDSDSPDPPSCLIDEQQLPSLFGPGWMHSPPVGASGQSLHLPPLSNSKIEAVSSPSTHAVLLLYMLTMRSRPSY
jgi:hypothetical protein